MLGFLFSLPAGGLVLRGRPGDEGIGDLEMGSIRAFSHLEPFQPIVVAQIADKGVRISHTGQICSRYSWLAKEP